MSISYCPGAIPHHPRFAASFQRNITRHVENKMNWRDLIPPPFGHLGFIAAIQQRAPIILSPKAEEAFVVSQRFTVPCDAWFS